MNDEFINTKAKTKEDIPDIINRRDNFYQQIKLLCDKYEVEYIDVSDKFDESDKKYIQEDLIHLNKEAYEILTKAILEKISK